jgi:hypothetical protein
MRSDFARARQFLERAFDHLQGADETSRHVQEALDLLIEAVATAEYSSAKTTATVLPFPASEELPVNRPLTSRSQDRSAR